ncbi:MAG: type III pantothenate kinase [Phycisphaera sp.]|nr:type III pantothenate kinase [Phycisphaera sp.]
MSETLIALSIGNTRTKIGAFAQGKPVSTLAIENTSRGAIGPAVVKAWRELDDPSAPVVVSSVNATVCDAVLASLPSNIRTARVERDLPIPIGRQLDPESIVGEDRLLNAAAAYDTLKQMCVVVDAGTAVTVDYVDGQGTFHGGAIAPGLAMMLHTLHTQTAQLPEVTFVKPEEPIGHNTQQAMRSGVYYALRGLVRELVEQYAGVGESWPIVVATGGDAHTLFEGCDFVDRTVPELTLLGIALTYKYAVANEEE